MRSKVDKAVSHVKHSKTGILNSYASIRDGVIYFKFAEKPNSVIVDNLRIYRSLIEISLDALQMQDGDISFGLLNTLKRKDKEIREWYTNNLNYQYTHEKAHYLAARKISTLSVFLGVCFYYDVNEVNSYPFVTFDGHANLKEFKEKVVSAPDEMSDVDLAFMKC